MRLRSDIRITLQTFRIFRTHKFLALKNLIQNARFSLTPIPHSSLRPSNHNPNTDSILSMLNKSKAQRSLSLAKSVHASILRMGFDSSVFISNNLLCSYCCCGSSTDVLHLFDGMLVRDVISWNTMISGFISLERFQDGMFYFIEMVRDGTRPTQSSFVSVIVASAVMGGIECLQHVHCLSLKSGFSSDCSVGNSLMKGYSKHGDSEDLQKVSSEMCGLDEISVEILLRGYSGNGTLGDALHLIGYCRFNGVQLSPFGASSLISLCSRVDCIDTGVQFHGFSVKLGLDTDVSVINSLISFYSKACRLEDAKNLFDWFGVPFRDIVSWNSIIGGFAYNGEGDIGLLLVQRMLCSGFRMNDSSFLSFLSCCAVVSSIKNAKKAHSLILKLSSCFNRETDNIALTMYCRSKSLHDAVALFEVMEVHDTVSFNLMMGLHRNYGRYEEAIRIFLLSRSQGIRVEEILLSGAIYCCLKLGFLELGQQIHGLIVSSGFEKDFYVSNSLLELYSGVGRLNDMERIFFNNCNKNEVFSWNWLLIGYSNHGLLDKCIGICNEMERCKVNLNEFSFSALLYASACANRIAVGEQIHAFVHKKGLTFDTALMNSLLTMYSNCGAMERAYSVFEQTSSPDSISWNALVSGYSQNGFAEESVKFYISMNLNGVEMNHMTFASICMSCAMLSELKLGSQFHAQVIKKAFESDLPVLNSLIIMYAKCGEISFSSKIFVGMAYKDQISWNSMINALSHHGLGREAIDVFNKMGSSGEKPNSVTFIGILSACSRAGLVSEACHLFKSMYEEHDIAPTEEHFSCMVDIFCRAGKLKDARDFVEGMPFIPSLVIWKILLSACRLSGDADLGKLAAKRIMDIEPEESSVYVLLSDLYASVGNREDKVEVRKLMKDRGVRKEAGFSWIPR